MIFPVSIFNHRIVPNIVSESESTQSILQLVSHGFGVSILPELIAIKEIERGHVKQIKITDEKMKRVNYIAWHKDKNFTKIMDEIISWKLV